MDTKLAGIFLVLRELGGFKIDELENRVFAQKAVFLLQLLGVDLRFRFSWYLRGPYSKALTQCLYEIDTDKDLQEKAIQLSLRPEIGPVLTKLKQWMASRPADLSESRWFELLSSIHYTKHISLPGEDISRDNIAGHLDARGKDGFKTDEIGEAWDTLRKAELIDHKKIDLRGNPAASG